MSYMGEHYIRTLNAEEEIRLARKRFWRIFCVVIAGIGIIVGMFFYMTACVDRMSRHESAWSKQRGV